LPKDVQEPDGTHNSMSSTSPATPRRTSVTNLFWSIVNQRTSAPTIKPATSNFVFTLGVFAQTADARWSHLVIGSSITAPPTSPHLNCNRPRA